MSNGILWHPPAGHSSESGLGNCAVRAGTTQVSSLQVGVGFAGAIMRDLPPPPTNDKQAEEQADIGETLRLAGQFEAARERYLKAIELCPARGEFYFLQALSEFALGRRDIGQQCLMEAVRLTPRLACAHEWLSQWYLEEGMVDAALRHSSRAIELAPQDASVAASQAYVLEAAGNLDAAWHLVQRLLQAGYTPAKVAALYARMAPPRGHTAQALELIQRLLNAGKYNKHEHAGLCFAAADLLDRLGRYDDAFTQASRGNQILRPAYNPVGLEREFNDRIEYFSREQMKCLPKASYHKIKPVFIVGMPRSGTSLMEQIVASHPGVYGAGETDLLKRVVVGTGEMLHNGPFPRCLDGLSLDTANGLAQIYLEPLAAMNPNATIFVDKTPLNFIFLPLVNQLLPEAKVIHCRRDPLDTCLSCYMTNFATANQFAYDLAHLGHFYRQYERLMDHYKAVLDLPILDVEYEQMVADPAGQIKRVLDFLGLSWDDRCLNFHQTPRPVTSSSVEQVRQPIYHRSVGRWKNYDKHLQPLRAALASTPAPSL
jgi:tetratricopeptide (TPR) repeat protein